MFRLVCCAALALALWSGTTLGCSLDSAASMTTCVKNILEVSRPALKAKFDPIRLPNFSEHSRKFSWSLSDIVINGAAGYRIDHLSVRPSPGAITIHFSISWPHLVANGQGWVRGCKRILWKNRCVKLRGRPRITLINPAGTLRTTLAPGYSGGRLVISPRDTKVDLSIPRVHVEPRLRGFLGFINRLIGNPARRYANRAAAKFLSRDKQKLEGYLKNLLNTLISKYLCHRLSGVLKGFKG